MKETVRGPLGGSLLLGICARIGAGKQGVAESPKMLQERERLERYARCHWPATDLPPTSSRRSTAKREGACVSVEMLWRERITEQSPPPSRDAASNAVELLRVDAPDRSGIQLVARVSPSRKILNR
jgi:hypothetical protein